jgi:transcriptional regulator NrdR family protein
MPVKVKKKDGRIEEYTQAKIVEGVRKAGATEEQATRVARDVTDQIVTVVTTTQLAKLVAASLKKVNPAAAAEYLRYRATKAKATKKKKK